LLSKEQQDKIVADTMVGGATLTGLIGTSAWYAPGAGTAAMVESIVRDEKKLISSGVYLDGEFGESDISLVVPVILGKNGVEQILDVKLTDQEQATFAKSANAVRSMNAVLTEMSLI
jgi:malate dehydrogenase